MSLLELSMIGVVLLACLYVSYTDTRFRKIGNLYTYGLVVFGLICQGVFVYLGVTTLLQLLWLLLGGLAAAFLMYYLGIWSPGDSKLFWGVSVALPPTLYQSPGYWHYPPFVIAVNTFVPYFLVMMIFILLRTTGRQKWQVLKGIFTPKFLLRFGLSMISFTGLSALLNVILPFNLDYSAIILFVVLFALFDRFVAREKQLYFLLPFSLVSIFLAVGNPAYFLTMLLVTTCLFLLFRFFVASLGDYLFVQEVDVNDLKKGAVPANVIVRDERGHYRPQEIAFTSFVSIASRPTEGEVIMDITPEGLSEEKVAELKELAGQGHFAAFGNKVKVQEAVPFAPIILLGVMLTILSRGVFLERFVELVGR